MIATQRDVQTRLPQSLQPLFWDYDFKELSWQSDRDLIISRILSSGDWQTVTWLRRQLSPDEFRQWLLERRGRGLDPRQLRFWELVLDLPHRVVDSWLKVMDRDVWQQRTGV